MEFDLNIKSDNAAMTSANDLIYALRAVINKISNGICEGGIKDLNGNSVGFFVLYLDDEKPSE